MSLSVHNRRLDFLSWENLESRGNSKENLLLNINTVSCVHAVVYTSPLFQVVFRRSRTVFTHWDTPQNQAAEESPKTLVISGREELTPNSTTIVDIYALVFTVPTIKRRRWRRYNQGEWLRWRRPERRQRLRQITLCVWRDNDQYGIGRHWSRVTHTTTNAKNFTASQKHAALCHNLTADNHFQTLYGRKW